MFSHRASSVFTTNFNATPECQPLLPRRSSPPLYGYSPRRKIRIKVACFGDADRRRPALSEEQRWTPILKTGATGPELSSPPPEAIEGMRCMINGNGLTKDFRRA